MHPWRCLFVRLMPTETYLMIDFVNLSLRLRLLLDFVIVYLQLCRCRWLLADRSHDAWIVCDTTAVGGHVVANMLGACKNAMMNECYSNNNSRASYARNGSSIAILRALCRACVVHAVVIAISLKLEDTLCDNLPSVRCVTTFDARPRP